LSMAGVAIGARVLAHFYVPLAGWEILMISWASEPPKNWEKLEKNGGFNDVERGSTDENMHLIKEEKSGFNLIQTRSQKSWDIIHLANVKIIKGET
jgi:hypothetical protein